MNKTKIINATLLSFALSSPVMADDLASRMDLPSWTEDMSVSVGMINDNLEFEGLPQADVDTQGVLLEISNEYALTNGFKTQSSLRGRITSSDDDLIEVDNKSIGIMQSISKGFVVNNMVLSPSVGLGVNYGGFEYGPRDDANDQQYISYSSEASLSLDTKEGIAPFVKYNYEVADVENTSNEVNIHAVSAGISAIF